MSQYKQSNHKESFNQLYVWEGNAGLGCSRKEFENVMFAVLNVRIKFYKCIKYEGAIGILFFVHDDDISTLMASQFSSCIKRYTGGK